MKKFLLTCLMLIASVPLWAHDFEVDGIYYNITSETTVGVTCRGSDGQEYSNEYTGSVTIPSSVIYNGNTYSVTSIGNEAFQRCSGLTSVTIGNSVTSIGEYAFSGCRGLTEITIPNSVTSIGNDAFSSTAWYNNQADGVIYINNVLYDYKGSMPGGTSISIKDGTVSISPSAFKWCTGLTSVTIPNSVVSIGDNAFDCCFFLTSVTIGNSVTSIGAEAFYYCDEIAVINSYNTTAPTGAPFEEVVKQSAILNVPSSALASYQSTDGWKDFANICEMAINGYYDFDVDGIYYRIISLTDLTVEVVAKDDTYNSYTGDVVIPETVSYRNREFNVISIGAMAFSSSVGLTSITIPQTVTSIGNSAFDGCKGLTKLILEDGEESISGLSFPGSPIETLYWGRKTPVLFMQGKTTLKVLTIGKFITEIGNSAFSGCTGLTEVTIPNSVTSIGSGAFNGCTGLTEVNIPNSVTTIGESAFMNCSALTQVELLEGVTTIEPNTFNGCTSLASIAIPGSVATIEESAFMNCNALTQVELSEGVTTVGASAFNGCTSLASIAIPGSVTSIGSGAFFECTGLTEVNISDLSAWCKIDFGNDSANPLSYSKKLNLNGTEITELVIPNDITEIKSNTFNGCSGLTKVTIPNSVTSIGSDTFSGCTGLTKLVLEDGTEQISELSFPDSPIETLYWGRNTPKLFMQGNTTLKELTIGKFVTKIKDYMFKNCTDLTSIAMSNSITEIGASAFNGCTSLISITIPGSVTTIGESAFMNCNALTQVELSEGVTTVGASAFNSCTSLASIAIPGSVTTIGGSVFSGCTALVDVIFKNGKDAIDMRGNTFKENPLVSLYIGRTMTNVKSPFNGIITLEKITLGSGMTSLQSDAFVGCKGIKELIIEGGEGAIAIDCKFNDSPIEKLHIGRNGTYAFNNRIELKEVSVGDNVTILPNNAFNGCSNITTLKLGKKLEKIGSGAFTGCATLMNVYSTNLTPPTGAVFENKTYLQGTLYVVKGSKAAYEAADGWKEFWEIVDNLPFEVNGIWYNIDENGNANVVGNPSGDSYMGEFTIPASVEIDGVTYPVTSIDAEAFANAINVTSITIEDSNQPLTIGAPATAIVAMSNDQAGTFEACMLDSVYVGRNLNYATAPFANISSLKKVAVGALVTSMGGAMFEGCKNINAVHSLSTIPPVEAQFDEDVYNNAVLYIAKIAEDAYATADGWKEFKNVVTTGSSMVEDINIEAVTGNVSIIAVNGEIVVKGAKDAQIAVYNINGGLIYHGLNRPVAVANKGVYVVVVNGIAMKVML